MAAGEYRIGLNGTFKHGAAGSPAGTISKNVDDVGVNLSKRVVEMIRRGKGYVSKKPIITEATLDFKCFDVVGDALVTALETAFFADARIALYPTTEQSGKGLDADYYITTFQRLEDNEAAVVITIKAEPTDEVRDPTWH